MSEIPDSIYIKGVNIKLTTEQKRQIGDQLKKRDACKNSFKRTLEHHGFKAYPELKNCFQHIYFNWWAEITVHDRYTEVWIVGPGLKCAGFPGGWTYGTPEEITEEITKYLDNRKTEN